MQWTYMGFSQQKLIDLGLDIVDASILRFVVEMSHSQKIKKMIIGDMQFAWISQKYLAEELPILGVATKNALSNRFKKLVDAGVLLSKSVPIVGGGSKCFYGFGPNYHELLPTGVPPQQYPGVPPQQYPGVPPQQYPDPSTSNPSTSNPRDIPGLVANDDVSTPDETDVRHETDRTTVDLNQRQQGEPADINNLADRNNTSPSVISPPPPSKKNQRPEEPQKPYGQYGNVRLTDRQKSELDRDYRDYELDNAIRKLDDYCEARGKKYKNYKAALESWVFGSLAIKKRGQL